MEEKGFEIEIRDVLNPNDTCYFSFYAIKVINNKYTAFADSLKCMDGGFYIYDLDIECFLWYFLKKGFDPGNKYNKERQGVTAVEENDFDWYGENYYTYDAMKTICSDILRVSSMLRDDYDNPYLVEIKEDYKVYRIVAEDDPDYNMKDNPEVIRRHIDVVIEFYERFVERVFKLMDQNSDSGVIVIGGI